MFRRCLRQRCYDTPERHCRAAMSHAALHYAPLLFACFAMPAAHDASMRHGFFFRRCAMLLLLRRVYAAIDRRR